MKAKVEEEQRGQMAADARRWTGLKNIVEARSLLKALFAYAANQKAQARTSSPRFFAHDYVVIIAETSFTFHIRFLFVAAFTGLLLLSCPFI